MSGASTGLEGFTGVLVDTSFVIRLLKADDPLHANAKAWFRELLDRKVPMYLSTIVIAEYCVKGNFDELPVLNMRVLPFNVDHARLAGPYNAVMLAQRSRSLSDERNVVLNDVKLLAQAEADPGISHIITKDGGFRSRMEVLREAGKLTRTTVLDLATPIAEVLNRLDL